MCPHGLRTKLGLLIRLPDLDLFSFCPSAALHWLPSPHFPLNHTPAPHWPSHSNTGIPQPSKVRFSHAWDTRPDQQPPSQAEAFLVLTDLMDTPFHICLPIPDGAPSCLHWSPSTIHTLNRLAVRAATAYIHPRGHPGTQNSPNNLLLKDD